MGANETLTIEAAGGSVAPVFPFANLYNNGSKEFDDGPITLILDRAEPSLDSAFYTLSDSSLTVVQSGTYVIYYGTTLIADRSNSKTAYDVWLEADGDEVLGSRRMVHIRQEDAGNSCSDLTVRTVLAGTSFRLRSRQVDGNREAIQDTERTRLAVVRLGD